LNNQLSLVNYQTIIFDCDGVILDSNKIKTMAFYEVAKDFGEQPAKDLVDFHLLHGGISRNKKFEYFLCKILNRSYDVSKIDEFCESFGNYVQKELLTCKLNTCLHPLKSRYPSSKWLVASGGNQEELRFVFKHRGIDNLFECGIFGSPDSKNEILSREIKNKNIIFPAIFIGDSKYDYLVSKEFNIDFLFLTEWTEFEGWKDYCQLEAIDFIKNLHELLN